MTKAWKLTIATMFVAVAAAASFDRGRRP